MALSPGTRIGVYEVTAQIGEGGMGQVYRAMDTTLGRQVAIKILPDAFAADPDRVARFEREAKTLASLNHPHVAAIYGFEKSASLHALVMELVEGDDVSQRIARGAIGLDEALPIAKQIAEALEAAHEQGIIHRDLKPANIKVRADGTVKVLDFGLAKAMAPPGSSPSVSQSPTITTPAMTRAGTILGTAAYLSPEQARGQAVDKRADNWAFGCVLYEMLAGRAAFSGATITDTLAAILERSPDWKALPGATPTSVRLLLQRCLQKDPRRRLRDIGDAWIVIDDAIGDAAPSPAVIDDVPGRRRRGAWAAPTLALAVCAIAAAIWWRSGTTTQTTAPPVSMRMTADEGLTADPAISSDGTLLAYASDREGSLNIWVQQVAGGSRPLRLTRGEVDEREPAFSPDGGRIVFRSERDGGALYVVATFGGEQPRLLAARGRRPKFSPDGRQVAYWTGSFVGFSVRPGAYRTYVVPAAGGPPREIAGFTGARFPIWSPDGRSLLILASTAASPVASSYDWWLVPLGDGAPIKTDVVERLRPLGVDLAGLSAGPDAWHNGEVFFSDLEHIWAIPLSPATGRAGVPRQVTFGTSLDVQPSVSESGVIAYGTIEVSNNVWTLPLDSNRGVVTGSARKITTGVGRNARASMSIDGRRIAYSSGGGERPSLLLRDIESGAVTDLGAGGAFGPALSPDGSTVAFEVAESGANSPRNAVRVISAAGGSSRTVCEGCTLGEWTRDSAFLLGVFSTDRPRHIDLIRVQDGARRPVIVSSRAIDRPQLGPDDRLVAFRARADLAGVFVAPVHAERAVAEPEWMRLVPDEEDVRPCGWSADGRLVYFLSARDGTRCLYAQRVDPKTGGPVGPPVAVQHFHGIRNYRPGAAGVISTSPTNAIRAGMLLFDYAAYTGNIWTMPAAR